MQVPEASSAAQPAAPQATPSPEARRAAMETQCRYVRVGLVLQSLWGIQAGTLPDDADQTNAICDLLPGEAAALIEAGDVAGILDYVQPVIQSDQDLSAWATAQSGWLLAYLEHVRGELVGDDAQDGEQTAA